MAGGNGFDRCWIIDYAQQHMVGGRCKVEIVIKQPSAFDLESAQLAIKKMYRSGDSQEQDLIRSIGRISF